eukprot:7670614-Pyramimonas_sp.AAC.1
MALSTRPGSSHGTASAFHILTIAFARHSRYASRVPRRWPRILPTLRGKPLRAAVDLSGLRPNRVQNCGSAGSAMAWARRRRGGASRALRGPGATGSDRLGQGCYGHGRVHTARRGGEGRERRA